MINVCLGTHALIAFASQRQFLLKEENQGNVASISVEVL
jgi:hypothetical protein